MSADLRRACLEVAALVERSGSRSPEVRDSCALRVLRAELARLELAPDLDREGARVRRVLVDAMNAAQREHNEQTGERAEAGRTLARRLSRLLSALDAIAGAA